MNGSSGFRGVPMTGSGASGSSTGNHGAANDMNSALRSHHPYFPRLESLTSPLYSTGELTPASVAAAAAASRLFPAHLSALHAAAVAAASNVPQTTATHHGMPPPSLSQFHQAAAAAAAAAANHHSVAAHHPLLSPFLYSHLSSPAYGNQGPTSGHIPTTAPQPLPPPQMNFIGGHPRHQYGLPVESAFIPTANVMPRYRYMLPPTTSPTTPTLPLAPATSARYASTLPTTSDRSLSESEYASAAAAIVRARRPSSPPKSVSAVTNNPTSSIDPVWPSANRPPLRIDLRPSIPSVMASTASTTRMSPETKTSVTSDSKKQQKVSGGLPTQPYYPSHFMKGTVIQLANGDLKRVEDLNTEDFVRSAHLTSELKIDTSQVVKIEEKSGDIVLLTFSVGGNKVQVSVEATVEHPFFVIDQGWSSFNPERSHNLYGLPCQRLQVGDICISLTHRDVAARAAGSANSSLSSSSTPNMASASGYSGGQRPQTVPSSTGAPNSASKPLGHSSSSETIRQQHPAHRNRNTTTTLHRSPNEDEERSRKRRKMTLPLRIGLPSARFVSPPRTLQLARRFAITPPGISVQVPPAKTRRRSVS